MMLLRTPGFWQDMPPTWSARVLSPAGWAMGEITRRRMAQAGWDAGVPVVCIGNFTAGGAGKTPMALWVADWLSAQGMRVAFLARGYGGGIGRGPVQVDVGVHSAQEVGDEPLLLAQAAPVIAGSDRVAAARLAVGQGADVLVMDDGLQNPSLRKTISLAIVDGASGIGNGLCLPAGPLRAPLQTQLPHVAGVVVVGPGAAGDDLAQMAMRAGKPAFRATLEPDAADAARLNGRNVVAFAGIGRPEKFFATLVQSGATLVGQHAFADHRPYRLEELEHLRAEARDKRAALVTTCKDRMRMGAMAAEFGVETLAVRLVPENPAALQVLLAPALAAG